MTFSQCVHGVYDEKMEAVYRKYSQNELIYVDSESTSYKKEEAMEFNYRKEGNRVVYYMPKEVDHHSAKSIALELDGLIETGEIGRASCRERV